tara:strand:+ start:1553 stop:2281 length:729 start_codon:yes stop_codon:yes gene_type:complete
MIYAIIPARSGSKEVPNKNIKFLGGVPLIAYSIEVAKMVPEIDRIIVSTDSEEYAKIANAFGAETPFLRPAAHSTDSSTDFSFFQHAIDWFEKHESKAPDLFLHLRPTTPFRNANVISDALKYMNSKPDSTSLRSGHLAPESPYKWFLKDKLGYFKSIIPGLTSEQINNPRQVFPPTFISNGYIDIIKTSQIKEKKNLHGDKMLIFETPFCNQVDTIEDFNKLEYHVKINPQLKILKNDPGK